MEYHEILERISQCGEIWQQGLETDELVLQWGEIVPGSAEEVELVNFQELKFVLKLQGPYALEPEDSTAVVSMLIQICVQRILRMIQTQIHRGVCQDLTAAKLELELWEMTGGKEPNLLRAKDLLVQTASNLRGLMDGLSVGE